MGGFVTIDRSEVLATLVGLALAEDVGRGDWTSQWTIDGEAWGRAVVVAKVPLVVAGLAAAVKVFRMLDPDLQVELRAADGFRARSEDVILEVSGRVQTILGAERTALNFLAHLSGVATLTRRFVEAIEGTSARIVDTRKTTPGWRYLEKDAVRAGGGFNHRMGLHDMVLVKDNHIAAAGGIEAAIRAVRSENDLDLPVEVEVGDLDQLEAALRLGVERVLLDNMAVDLLREAVRRTHALGENRPELEASGNVTLETVRSVAETGVDLISVGALTHSAPAVDLSLRVVS
jgi:nicotinate-nucleotide pyrophosphorylase (carboxylating)